MTPFNAWTRKVGPPSGITFGDRFLQIGDFCAGDADGSHLSVSYFPWRSWAGKGGVYRYSTDFPPGLTAALDIGNAYGYLLNDRYANWRCGSIQEVIGSCAGFVTGEDFVQIGDWRLSADDDRQFLGVAHRWSGTQVFCAEFAPIQPVSESGLLSGQHEVLARHAREVNSSQLAGVSGQACNGGRLRSLQLLVGRWPPHTGVFGPNMS